MLSSAGGRNSGPRMRARLEPSQAAAYLLTAHPEATADSMTRKAQTLEAVGLTKKYGPFKALDSLNLKIEGSKCVGFLGPNGAGKTTTLKIFTGLIRPSAGRALVNGMDVHTQKRKALATVAALVETPEIYSSFTPNEALMMIAKLRGVPPEIRRKKVEDALHEVRMEDWRDKKVGEFSKGMKQRVNIASTLLNDPEIVLLDEPSSGLDPRGMSEVREIIRSLKERKRLVFMSSHLLAEVTEASLIGPRGRLSQLGKGECLNEGLQLTSQPGGSEEFAPANNTVPSPLAQAVTQFEYEFLNYLRSKRFYILLAITATIGLAISGALYYYRPPAYLSSPLAFYSVWWGSVASLFVILSGIFYGADAISTEFQNKTSYYLLPNPVNRSSVYLGKFLAAFVASAITVAVFAAITVADASIYFGANIPIEFAESFLFTVIYTLPMLGIAFFFSSVFKNNSYSILVSVMVLWIGFSYLLPLIVTLTGSEPWYLLSYGGQIIGNVVRPSGYPAHVTVAGGITTSYATTVPEGLAIMLGYLIVFVILGLVLFEHKDFD